MRKLTLTEAIQRLTEASANRYTFELKEYKNQKQKVKCKCNKCGNEWEAAYNSLVNKKGCAKCAGNLKLTYIEAQNRLSQVAESKYTFEMVEYCGMDTKIKCKCNKCNAEWEAIFEKLTLKKTGCPYCSKTRKLTLTEAIQRLTEASANRYTFELKEYTNAHQKVKCKCNKCGYEWETSYNSLVNHKSGCAICNYAIKTDYDRAYRSLAIMAKGRYTFELKEYTNAHQKVKCKCNKCGNEWEATYNNLVSKGYGCVNRCYIPYSYISQPEVEIVEYLRDTYPQLEVQQSIYYLIKSVTGKSMEIDIYIPKLKLAFEYNGTYWHSDEVIQKRTKGIFTNAKDYHNYKTAECDKIGVKLIHLFESDFNIKQVTEAVNDKLNECGLQ